MPESVDASDTRLLGRLAPSPTGAQHIGNARTYLIAWLSARTQDGRLLLRIEDIDSPRVKSWATDQIYDDFQWLGLDWDDAPIIQSNRIDRYRSALALLQEQELVYPCTCSRRDVELAASAPHQDHEGPVYPGTCAHRRASDAANLTDPFSWRFRVTNGIDWIVEDRFLGRIEISADQCAGDFVIWKANDTPAYQLAVVVDDAEAGVTEVVRGDDLLSSTPRQMMLYEAFGLHPPQFMHVPLVVGADRRRLAKRHGDTRLSSLRSAGVDVKELLGLLAWSCGWSQRISAVSLKELLEKYDVTTIPREPFVVDDALLAKIGYRTAR